MKSLQLFTSFILLFSFGKAMAHDGEPMPTKPQQGFIENKGQVTDQNHKRNDAVVYLLNTPGLNVQLRRGGFSYDTYAREVTGTKAMPDGKTRPETRYDFHRVDIALEGSNPNCEILTEGRSADFLNYYNTGEEILNVHHYGKVTYKNIYKGIDLEFTTNPVAGKAVEYNFIVAPGADASQIKLRYDGANNTTLADNKIKLALRKSEIAETIPASFTATGKKAVAVTYRQIAANTYGFNVPAYNTNETLIIDPTPDRSWGTYYGGADYDFGLSMTMVGTNIYVAGTTESTSQIATFGSHQPSYAGAFDGFVCNFSNTGTPAWCTYYGGTGEDNLYPVAASTSGVVIGGYTNSTNGISTAGAHQVAKAGGLYDGFVVKFSVLGTRLWGTYYGGTDDDFIFDVATDAAGNVYCSGHSGSLTGIATPGSAQPALNGGNDAFLVKFNGIGIRQWATYAGDAYAEVGRAVTVDPSGNVYLVGTTSNSIIGPYALVTVGAHQTVHGGGSEDNFIEKYDPSGTRLWGTFYGGSGTEEVLVDAVTDGSGNLYICGTTNSANNIATPGAAITSHSSSYNDGYIAKFNSAGVRQWGTYYGADAGNTYLHGLTVAGGSVYAAGDTRAPAGMATPNAYQTTFNSISSFDEDGCIVKLDAGTSAIGWSTYYGDGKSDIIYGIGADASNRVYVSGSSNSPFGMGSTGAHKTVNTGDEDMFLARFHECGTVTGTTLITNTCGSASYGTITVTPSGGATPYQYKVGAGGYQSSPTLGGLAGGNYTVTIKDDNGCEGTVNAIVGQSPAVSTPVITGQNVVERDKTTIYNTTLQGGATYTWSAVGGNITSGQNTISAYINWTTIGNGNVKVVVTGIAPCTDSASMLVRIDAPASVKDVNAGTLVIYPNPNTGSFVLKGNTGAQKQIAMQVLNTAGSVVYADNITATNGSIEKQYNLPQLANGIYTIMLKGDGGRQDVRLVIAR